MEKDSLTYKTLKNSAYSFSSYVWPTILSIFITPIIIFKLGVRDYGIYIFMNTLISVFYLFSLGIGTSTIKHLSEYLAKRENEKAKRLIYSMNSIFFLVGIIGLITFVILGLSVDYFFPQKIAGYENYFTIFLLSGIYFLISSISSIFDMIIGATQRFDISSKISIVSLTSSNILILIIVTLKFSLIPIFVSQIIILIITTIISSTYCKKIFVYSNLKYYWDTKEIIKGYKFGFSAFITDTAGTSLNYLDRILITFLSGPTQLTYYSIPGNITTRIPGITNSLSSMILPVTSNLASKKNFDSINKFYTKTFRLLTILSYSISISVAILSYKILFYWLNEDFAQKTTLVLIILSITNLFVSLQGPLNRFLLALGKTKFVSIFSISIAITNAILLMILIPKFGIIGAAISYLISILPILFMFHYTERNFLKIRRTKKHLLLFIKLFTTTIPFYIIIKFFLYNLITNITIMIIVGPVSVFIFLVLFRIFNFFEGEDWNDILNFIRNVFNTIKLR